MRLFFPYVENELKGIFGKGIRRGLKINYTLLLFPGYPKYPASHCFDGDPSTFCHTNGSRGDVSHYVQVHFLDLKLKIKGFAFQNRNGNQWDLLNYDLQGSNDGVNFRTIKPFNEDSSQVCGAGKIRTNKISTLEFFSYFRFLNTGVSCFGNSVSFNFAEIDLYGTLVSQVSIKVNNMKRFSTFIYVLIFILLS